MEPPQRVGQMISRELGAGNPRTIANIAEAARKLDGPHYSLRDYVTAYIFDPIRALEYPYQLVVVVDGLDEWRNYESFLAELAISIGKGENLTVTKSIDWQLVRMASSSGQQQLDY
ncbi:hypothetical protein H0H81_000400 [Sphagnurus paluster]|uniref:Uncharacterized protein n=1 Tax=Sphagnurus paluster TaxID=117069 RepID=A0A9P7FQ22_9AGAR|nr:hypothetical protein H0H81_000400 [Sphagnurus paluster]